jgi:hypothetical protein
MTDNAIKDRLRGRLSGSHRYVDNYDRQAPGLHPNVRRSMDPVVDTLERSQMMRGAATPDIDVESELADWAKRLNVPMPTNMEEAAALMEKAQGEAATDEEIASVARLAKTLGMPMPGGYADPGAKSGADYALGNSRPRNFGPADDMPADIPYMSAERYRR